MESPSFLNLQIFIDFGAKEGYIYNTKIYQNGESYEKSHEPYRALLL